MIMIEWLQQTEQFLSAHWDQILIFMFRNVIWNLWCSLWQWIRKHPVHKQKIGPTSEPIVQVTVEELYVKLPVVLNG